MCLQSACYDMNELEAEFDGGVVSLLCSQARKFHY